MKLGLVAAAVCGFFAASAGSARGVAAAGVVNVATAPPQVHCSGHGGADSMTMADAENSPLYTLVKGKLGEPTNCSIQLSEQTEVFTLTFAQGAKITFTDNSILELSEASADLPAGVVNLAEAVQTLKALEKDNSPKGLGVKWSALTGPVPSGDAELTAEGKSCNAKARVKFSGGAVVGLGFSAAC
jgi:hypothetical protein